MRKVTRRQLLAGAAAGSALLGASGRAKAFSEEQAPVKLRLLHEANTVVAHKELVAEVERALGDKYTEAEKREVIATLTCPICGRPLIAFM
jgi:hypothetical protein